jgi:hypothetical protein
MDNDLSYIDYSVFLGMNALAEPARLACKAFLADRFESRLWMTWDHVGRCDDIIWSYSRRLQDLYYPFMDVLHSQRCLQREGYQDSSLRLAVSDPRLQPLPVLHRLLVAQALERGAVVYTIDRALLDLAAGSGLPIRAVPDCEREREFPSPMEQLYRASLELRVPF